jgi:hypothetical protein
MENLMSSNHKATNKKSRKGYLMTTWNTKRPCWRCDGKRRVVVVGKSDSFTISCPECG